MVQGNEYDKGEYYLILSTICLLYQLEDATTQEVLLLIFKMVDFFMILSLLLIICEEWKTVSFLLLHEIIKYTE